MHCGNIVNPHSVMHTQIFLDTEPDEVEGLLRNSKCFAAFDSVITELLIHNISQIKRLLLTKIVQTLIVRLLYYTSLCDITSF
jgi:hypothetical protein